VNSQVNEDGRGVVVDVAEVEVPIVAHGVDK
jgi:hypothetical protein